MVHPVGPGVRLDQVVGDGVDVGADGLGRNSLDILGMSTNLSLIIFYFLRHAVLKCLLNHFPGAMMYVEKDGMNAACGKLDAALGGANYLGIHTFGEQGSNSMDFFSCGSRSTRGFSASSRQTLQTVSVGPLS